MSVSSVTPVKAASAAAPAASGGDAANARAFDALLQRLRGRLGQEQMTQALGVAVVHQLAQRALAQLAQVILAAAEVAFDGGAQLGIGNLYASPSQDQHEQWQGKQQGGQADGQQPAGQRRTVQDATPGRTTDGGCLSSSGIR